MKLTLRASEFEIRPVTTSELPQVLKVYRQCEDFLALGPVPQASMQMVLADLKLSQDEGGVFCGIYRADGEMLGVVDFVPSGFEGVHEHAYLSLLMIGQPFRRDGLGTAVVDCIEDEIKKDPAVTTVRAGVQVNNPHAIRFWQGKGYRIISGAQFLPDQTVCFQLIKPIRLRSKSNAGAESDFQNQL